MLTESSRLSPVLTEYSSHSAGNLNLIDIALVGKYNHGTKKSYFLRTTTVIMMGISVVPLGSGSQINVAV